jgi:hypothetical protein
MFVFLSVFTGSLQIYATIRPVSLLEPPNSLTSGGIVEQKLTSRQAISLVVRGQNINGSNVKKAIHHNNSGTMNAVVGFGIAAVAFHVLSY